MLKKLVILGILIMACCGNNCCSKETSAQTNAKVEVKKEIVIQFSADWCGPCRNLKGLMKSNEMTQYVKENGIKYYILDIDKNDENTKLWVDYAKPKTIPLVVKYRWNEEMQRWLEVKRFIGSKNASFMKEWLKK